MKAMRFHEYGAPDVLQYEDVDEPAPGAGQVRVRVAAAGFNPADAGLRGGWLQQAFPLQLPHVLGYDVAGTVEALGDGVTALQVGDPVVGFLSMLEDGANAQSVVAPAEDLVDAPTSIPLVEAAALPSVATTAWQSLFDAADLQAGQRVLVNGAGGAVGAAAVQLALHAGAHVLATTSPRSIERIAALGAHEVLDHTAGPVEVAEPVDVLLNTGPLTPEALAALTTQVADGGVVVNTVPALPTPGDPERGVRGVGVFVRSDRDDLQRIVALVDQGALRVAVDEQVPLEDLRSVHERSDAGRLTGKVVIVPAD